MMKIALIGNYPPRKCGIATFTRDLNEGLKAAGVSTAVIAINDGIARYDYPGDVALQIEQNEIASYINAAYYLNTNDFDAIILQHEFGIFGGPDGRHVIQLLRRLRVPVITTFHTILDDPSGSAKQTLCDVARFSERVVSISKKGIGILTDEYGIPVEKCMHIHHGVHRIDIRDVSGLRRKNGVDGKKVLLTFGLLSQNKSIEVVIKALPKVIESHPEVVYLVLGATHPHVIRHEGEAYRHSLIRLVKQLKLEKHVIFIDRFVSNEELFAFLSMCDIYVIPYRAEKQISSGTLIYTMGAQKPIVSTPFWYAREMLADGRGCLFDFDDSTSLSAIILDLLENDSKRNAIARKAFELARECYWPAIGELYADAAEDISRDGVSSLSESRRIDAGDAKYSLPPIDLRHLRVLTDYTGILQHARYNIPDRRHGYCIDDNSRALILSVMLQEEVQEVDDIRGLTSIYLSYIDYAWNPEKKSFRNFMSYERRWLEDEGSADSTGRALWALGYTAARTNLGNFYRHADQLFKTALQYSDTIVQPRPLSYLILGLAEYVRFHRDPALLDLLADKTRTLLSFFEARLETDWPWCEELVTYGNSRIPQALIAAGVILQDDLIASSGLRILDWLIAKQFSNGIFSPVGNDGWLTRESKSCFDQQPLEAHGMIDACLEADGYDPGKGYGDYALRAFAWFTGDNDCSRCLYDFASGGCRDGLHAGDVNQNQGAESTLSWLMSLVRISQYQRKNEEALV
ncbi:MAG TPA: glycosyltransferase family 4 protein [Treponemataceae bacterium]|nr:glycosyltransferase family 4 protein [Treponemataceae bacterium]